MRNHGVACVHREGAQWEFSCADTKGYRFYSGTIYEDTETDTLRLIADISNQLTQMEVTTSRVILVDTLPNVDAIFYKLAGTFNFPLVVDQARLKLHEKRLGKTFQNVSELGAEAAVSGWTTEILLIETTNVCTFRCLYCPQDIMQRKKERLPLPTVEKIIEEYASNALGTLGFHVMGEPTANPDLPKIVELAAKLHIGHALITNASILDRETAEDLFRKGLRHIMVSVQTFTKEQHDAIKRPAAPKYSYEATMRNVKDIILAKWAVAPDARLEIHVMDNSICRPRGVNVVANNTDAQRVISFWQNYVREAALEFGDPSLASSLPHQDAIDFSQITWPLGEYTLAPMVFLQFKKAGHWIQNFTLDNEFIIPAMRGTCQAVARNFTQHRQLGILSNGDAVMCCFDYDGKTAFANIEKNALADIDSSAELYREQLVGGNGIPFLVCKKCLGLRVKGFDDNFSSRKDEEIIAIKRVAIYYDSERSALTLLRRLTNAGLEGIAFVERPNPTFSLAARGESREGVRYCTFEQIPKETEVVLFCPEWAYDNSVVEKIKNQYPTLLIGQVDPVALDPYRPQTAGTENKDILIAAQRRENLLEKELVKLRDENKILQKRADSSFLSRIATLKLW